MSTITKEWLQKAISQHESMRDEIPFGLDEDDSNTLEALRIALSSLEAEAVAFVMADDLKDSSIISTPAYRDLGEAMERTVGDVVALYAAPPAPVSAPKVPNSVTAETCSLDELGHDWNDAEYYAQGWNACRAAMLQGADGNSPVIPDGVCPCCGRKPLKNRTCSVSGCDGKHVARGFCIKHYAIERKKDPSRRKSIRAADKRYRARKAAAPQQEVK